jgi:hypothetical protein
MFQNSNPYATICCAVICFDDSVRYSAHISFLLSGHLIGAYMASHDSEFVNWEGEKSLRRNYDAHYTRIYGRAPLYNAHDISSAKRSTYAHTRITHLEIDPWRLQDRRRCSSSSWLFSSQRNVQLVTTIQVPCPIDRIPDTPIPYMLFSRSILISHLKSDGS